MGDAFQPHTSWICEASRSLADVIELDDVLSQELYEFLDFFTDEDGHLDTLHTVQTRVKEHLLNKELLPGSDPNPLAKYVVLNANPYPIRNILKSLSRYGEVCGLLEHPYLDLEFWDTHAGFYDKSFREHPRYCERVHFFWNKDLRHQTEDSQNLTQKDREKNFLEELRQSFYSGDKLSDITNKHGGSKGFRYLGYLVLRPTLSCSVCCAATRFDDRTEDVIASDFNITVKEARKIVGNLSLEYGGKPYLKTSHTCQANVLSTAMTIETMEFMQQDPNLGACATVTLWVAGKVMADSFGLNRFNYATITRQAIGEPNIARDSVIFDPTNLNVGLYPKEIVSAISRTGAKALRFAPIYEYDDIVRESMRLQQEVYSFIESGVPIILGLGSMNESEGDHAVVVVGHNLPSYETVDKAGFVRPANQLISGIDERHYLVSSLVPVYYVHDDAYGPFTRVVFFPDGGMDEYRSRHPSNIAGSAASCDCPKMMEEGADPACPIRVLCNDDLNRKPPYPIVSRGSDTRQMYLLDAIAPVPPMVQTGSVDRLHGLLTSFDEMEITKSFVKKFGEEVKFLWRSLLIEGADFKASTARRNYSSKIIEWYSQLMLPKYIWLFEVSIVYDDSCWEQHFMHNKHRRIMGEFLVDPTIPSSDFRCLAFRMRNIGFDYCRNKLHGPNGSNPIIFSDDQYGFMFACYRQKEKDS